MKNLLFILLFIPVFAFSQTIKSDSGDIIDLATDSCEYVNIIFASGGFSTATTVIYNDNKTWTIVDEKKSKVSFANITALMNYMYRYGFEFIEFVPKTNTSTNTILTFKRRRR